MARQRTEDYDDFSRGQFYDDSSVARYEYNEVGHLMLQYGKDDAFTAKLRALVPQGFLTYQRRPFCWIIDADYAEDALSMAYQHFDDVENGVE